MQIGHDLDEVPTDNHVPADDGDEADQRREGKVDDAEVGVDFFEGEAHFWWWVWEGSGKCVFGGSGGEFVVWSLRLLCVN